MTIRLQDLISATCSDVQELTTATQTQLIFQIGDVREAKLAFDLLKVYGFDAKLYNENGGAKLYVTQPKARVMENQALLAEALAYGRCLKSLKQQADTIAADRDIAAPDYSINFASTPSLDKQITLHVVAARREITQQSTPPGTVAAPAGSVSAPSMASRFVQKLEEDIFSGPEIMRQPGFRRSKIPESKGPDTLWKQFKTYLKGNAMSAGLTLGACFAVLIVVISLFVVSKAFLCPDFAHFKDKTPPWYCTYHEHEPQ